MWHRTYISQLPGGHHQLWGSKWDCSPGGGSNPRTNYAIESRWFLVLNSPIFGMHFSSRTACVKICQIWPLCLGPPWLTNQVGWLLTGRLNLPVDSSIIAMVVWIHPLGSGNVTVSELEIITILHGKNHVISTEPFSKANYVSHYQRVALLVAYCFIARKKIRLQHSPATWALFTSTRSCKNCRLRQKSQGTHQKQKKWGLGRKKTSV